MNKHAAGMIECERCAQEVHTVGNAGVLAERHARQDGTPCELVRRARTDDSGGYERVRRWDAGELGAPVKLDNGWIRVQARIARVGIQEYTGPGGELVRELRLPEEVFDEASIASFRLVPLTNTHPPQLLDALNAKQYTVGSIGELRREGDWLAAEILITEATARQDAERGRSELSNGYECDLDPKQIPELVEKWGPYDSIQRKIRGNHCALVDEARAGHDARARMDAGEKLMVASNSAKRGASPMPHTVKIDGLTLEVSDANSAAIQQAIDKALEAAKSPLQTLTQRAELAEGKAKRAFGLFDGLYDVLKRGKKRRDAMKARMVSCDECGGTGEVKDEDGGAAKQCDYCDGKGEFRMHDKMADLSSGKSVEPESAEHGEAGKDPTDDGDGDGDEDDMDDADELAMERETEESGAAAEGKSKKKDALDAKRRARKDSRRDTQRKLIVAAAKARKDSFERRVARAVKSRSRLEAVALTHCGEGFKCDGKTDLELRKAVIAKAWPEVKLDGKSAEYIAARFDIAVEELGAGLTGVDRIRQLAGGSGGGRTDGLGSADPEKARAEMIKRSENVHAVKTAGGK